MMTHTPFIPEQVVIDKESFLLYDSRRKSINKIR
jgi:hypothetical protein